MRLIRDEDEAIEALKNETQIAIDLETGGLSPFKSPIAVITMYGDKSDVAVILHIRGRAFSQKLIDFFERPGILWIGHNCVSFDFPFMATAGVNWFKGQKFFDTLTAATVATITGRKNTKQKLAIVLERELGVAIDKSIADHARWMDPILDENQITYCLGDIVHLHALMRKLEAKCQKDRQLPALRLEMEIIPAVLRMVLNGMPIDKTKFDSYLAEQFVLRDQIKEKLDEVFGPINMNSPKQLKDAFAGHGVRLESTAKNALRDEIYDSDYDADVWLKPKEVATRYLARDFPTMDVEEKKFAIIALVLAFRVVEQRIKMYAGTGDETTNSPKPLNLEQDFGAPVTAQELSSQINNIRKGRKKATEPAPKKAPVRREKAGWWLDHVVEGFLEDGVTPDNRAHATYWTCSTDTGRWASSNPNLQQVPGDMRTVFGNLPGYTVLSCDYAQIEVWVMAILCEDDNMLQFLESGDMHSRLAQAAFHLPTDLPVKEFKKVYEKERKKAKAMTFALLFGGGPTRLYKYLRSEGTSITQKEAEDLYLQFSRLFPRFHEFRKQCRDKCNSRNAIPVQLPSTLVRLLVGDSLKYTTLMNTLVQGSAAAGLKNALRMIVEDGHARYLCAAVHDELVLVVPNDQADYYAELIPRYMVKGLKEMIAKAVPKALTAGITAAAAMDTTWIH